MTLARRSFIAGTSAVLGLGSKRARAAEGRIRFLTNWYAQPEHGGFYQALATGLYRKAGLDVQIEPGGPQINNSQLLLSGSADVVLSQELFLMQSVQRGMPLVMIATSFQFDPLGIVTHPDVPSLAALKGHKVLISPVVQPVVWPLLMRRYGLDPGQLGPYMFNLQPFLVDPTLATQSYVTSEPYDLKRKGVPFHFLLLRDAGLPGYGNPLATTRDVLHGQTATLRAFLAASMQGWKDYFADPEPANRLIKAANPLTDAGRIAYSIGEMKRLGLVCGGDAASQGIGIMTEQRWQEDFKVFADLGMLPANFDWRSAFDLSLIRDIRVLPG